MEVYCECSCPIGYYRAGCDYGGTCEQCTNGQGDVFYTSDGGSSSQCEGIRCEAANFCLPGQELVNCSSFSSGICVGEPIILTTAPATTILPTTMKVATTTFAPIQNTTVGACPAVCGDPMNPVTCEELMEQFGFGCQQAAVYMGGCDCSSCPSCMTTTPPLQTTVLTENVCPETCQWNNAGEGRSCDYFRSLSDRSCAALEFDFGCDCTGCSSCENITTTGLFAHTTIGYDVTSGVATTPGTMGPSDRCPRTCGDPLNPVSCNDLVASSSMTCPQIEQSRGCDCANCSACITTTPLLTTPLGVSTVSAATTIAQGCRPSCGDDGSQTCEEVMAERHWSCEQAEGYGCDCTNCICPTTTTTATNPTVCYGVCDPDVDYNVSGAFGPCGSTSSAECCAKGGEFTDSVLGFDACFCTIEQCGGGGFFCRNCDDYLTTTQPICPQCGDPGEVGQQTCNDVVTELGLQCATVESTYGCSCYGCPICAEPTAMPTTTFNVTVSAGTTTALCPATCTVDGFTCDELIAIEEAISGNISNATCESIENDFGCDCRGCLCDHECEATCGDANNLRTCDELMEDPTNGLDTCEEIEVFYNGAERRIRRNSR